MASTFSHEKNCDHRQRRANQEMAFRKISNLKKMFFKSEKLVEIQIKLSRSNSMHQHIIHFQKIVRTTKRYKA